MSMSPSPRMVFGADRIAETFLQLAALLEKHDVFIEEIRFRQGPQTPPRPDLPSHDYVRTGTIFGTPFEWRRTA